MSSPHIKTLIALVLALTLRAAASAEGQKPLTIGVLRIAGPHRTLANDIGDLLTADLSVNEQFSLVDRTELDKVLSELELGQSGTVNPDTASKVGHLTGAKVLVTGREMRPNGNSDVVIIANIIGTETGRVFSQTMEGPRSNIVALVSDLSQRISETILKQSTNLVAGEADTPEQRLEGVMAKFKGKPQPAVLIKIDGMDAAGRMAQSELGRIFQKAGFTVVDDRSDQRPDVLITGDAIATAESTQRNLSSGRATLEIKAQERMTGAILALDLQQETAADAGEQAAADTAMKTATDELAERLLPKLAR